MRASHRVAMNTGILYARMGITVFLSLYTTRVILNALGAGDFGIFNIVGGAIAMLTFLNSGMTTATQRFMSYAQGEGDPEKQKNIFNVSVVLHATIALIVLVLLEGAGWVMFRGVFKIAPDRMHAAQLVYQFAAISTVFTILSVPYDAVINARENMLMVAVLGAIEAVLKLLVALFIVHSTGDKLIIYGFWMAGITVLLVLLRGIFCHWRYEECVLNPRMYFKELLFRKMKDYAGWSLIGSAASLFTNYGQSIVVNSYFGTAVNAAQGVAGQVSGQLGAFSITMMKALNPLLAKSEGAGNRLLMIRAAFIGCKAGLFLLLLFYVPVFLEMPYVFKLWLKNPPEYSIVFCRLLLLRNLVEQLYQTLSASISAVGDIKSFQISSSIVSLLPLGVTVALYAIGFSPVVLYYVYFLYAVAMVLVAVYYSSKLIGMSVREYLEDVVIRSVVTVLLCGLISWGAGYFITTNSLRMITICAVHLLTFPIAVLMIGLTRSERLEILSTLRIILNRWFPNPGAFASYLSRLSKLR